MDQNWSNGWMNTGMMDGWKDECCPVPEEKRTQKKKNEP